MFFASVAALFAQTTGDPLAYRFSGGYGQVEVGGPYVGAEFHESRPLPSRISFYSPVANSIDLSTDYWKRADSRPLAAGLRVDGGVPHWIGRDAWAYTLSPHKVRFEHAEDGIACAFTYEFGIQEPIMVLRMTFMNTGTISRHLDVYFHLKTTLRTCQTYARFDSAFMSYEDALKAVVARFKQPQTDEAAVFVQNVGAQPSGWAVSANVMAITDSGTSDWRGRSLDRQASPLNAVPGCAAYTYDRVVPPGDSLSVTLVIGSCGVSELNRILTGVPAKWSADVDAYDQFVRDQAEVRPVLRTGDEWVDRSAVWAKAILATNAHYLDGFIVPMPCPAEYNFFFTHDMLLTDLAAVAFDPTRVRADLLMLKLHSRDSVIPHAYYWRDDGFKTEYCPPDDWNHLWFVLASATYLRHTMDTVALNFLYPLLTKSIGDAMLRLGKDHLMEAAAPDWWDIGKNPGPRSYMTVLVIRALRDYTYISAVLGERLNELPRLERTAGLMEESLSKRLWDPKLRYLININKGRADRHLYMGSLLAPVFGVLNPTRSRELVATAGRVLLAPGVGIRTVMPADFHTDSLRRAFHFVGNEAGDPYLYANGGVWPHNNAWYALALRAIGRVDDAFSFYRSTMTLDGIAQSPMGQPAFYEYRYSNQASPEYGRIDKPSFLWAAGFTLYTGYRLLGFDEHDWNLSVGAPMPSSINHAECLFEFGGVKQVSVGRGGGAFQADGKVIPSRVIPLSVGATKQWTIGPNAGGTPCLTSVNAVLHDVSYDATQKSLLISISSYSGHQTQLEISSASAPRRILVDGTPLPRRGSTRLEDSQTTRVNFPAGNGVQKIVAEF